MATTVVLAGIAGPMTDAASGPALRDEGREVRASAGKEQWTDWQEVDYRYGEVWTAQPVIHPPWALRVRDLSTLGGNIEFGAVFWVATGAIFNITPYYVAAEVGYNLRSRVEFGIDTAVERDYMIVNDGSEIRFFVDNCLFLTGSLPSESAELVRFAGESSFTSFEYSHTQIAAEAVVPASIRVSPGIVGRSAGVNGLNVKIDLPSGYSSSEIDPGSVRMGLQHWVYPDVPEKLGNSPLFRFLFDSPLILQPQFSQEEFSVSGLLNDCTAFAGTFPVRNVR